MDDYVAEVLAGEGQPRAGAAAQQALAITARTFAMANRNRHRAEGFDLCDTTHCQVVRPATPATRQAARATGGQVLLARGPPAMGFFSAWCGGRGETPPPGPSLLHILRRPPAAQGRSLGAPDSYKNKRQIKSR